MPNMAHMRITIHDIPQLMAVLEAAAEVVRVAQAQGFVAGDSADIEHLHRALDCAAPRYEPEADGAGGEAVERP